MVRPRNKVLYFQGTWLCKQGVFSLFILLARLISRGPHYFRGKGLLPKENDKNAVIYHYPYSRFRDLTQKARRNECTPPTYGALDRDHLAKECFVFEFDADVYIASVENNTRRLLELFENHVMFSSEEKTNLLLGGFLIRSNIVRDLLLHHEENVVCTCTRSLGVYQQAHRARNRQLRRERIPISTDEYLLHHY